MAQSFQLFTILVILSLTHLGLASAHSGGFGEQALSKISIEKATLDFHVSAWINAYPSVLGLQGEDTEWVSVDLVHPNPAGDDWVGVFSPAIFNSSNCPPVDDPKEQTPYICSAPIKYKYANFDEGYTKTGKASLKFQIINQRADFSFALFSGGLSNPKLVAISNFITFANPNAPVYPRLAQGKSWNEMTVTWTSGYDITEAVPFVEWGMRGDIQKRSPAGTLTFDRNSLCGSPAKTVGWRNPGFIHTSFLKNLWPNFVDHDFGFVKLTAFNHSSLLFEYKKSNDGQVHDSFTISRDYTDVLACVHDSCEPTTAAS